MFSKTLAWMLVFVAISPLGVARHAVAAVQAAGEPLTVKVLATCSGTVDVDGSGREWVSTEGACGGNPKAGLGDGTAQMRLGFAQGQFLPLSAGAVAMPGTMAAAQRIKKADFLNTIYARYDNNDRLVSVFGICEVTTNGSATLSLICKIEQDEGIAYRVSGPTYAVASRYQQVTTPSLGYRSGSSYRVGSQGSATWPNGDTIYSRNYPQYSGWAYFTG